MPRKSKKEIDLEDMEDDSPPEIEPYTVLGIEKKATTDQIKSAYRKAALKYHPDKASEDKKDEAHTKFQEIAFAYAVLSDPIRRKRYDTTGSTAESIDFEDFSWSEFYSEQFKDVVTSDAIQAFSKQYKSSVEEKDDVLAAYEKYKGKWSKIYEVIMLSDPLEDEDRFREMIDEAIEKGEVQAFRAYTNETEKAKEARMNAARRDGKEAEDYAKELGLHDKLFGNGSGGNSGEDTLKALIQKKQALRGASFLDHLEAKYGAEEKKSKGKKGKKRASEDEEGEPSEEAFQAAAKRLKKGKENEAGAGKKSKKTKH